MSTPDEITASLPAETGEQNQLTAHYLGILTPDQAYKRLIQRAISVRDQDRICEAIRRAQPEDCEGAYLAVLGYATDPLIEVESMRGDLFAVHFRHTPIDEGYFRLYHVEGLSTPEVASVPVEAGDQSGPDVRYLGDIGRAHPWWDQIDWGRHTTRQSLDLTMRVRENVGGEAHHVEVLGRINAYPQRPSGCTEVVVVRFLASPDAEPFFELWGVFPPAAKPIPAGMVPLLAPSQAADTPEASAGVRVVSAAIHIGKEPAGLRYSKYYPGADIEREICARIDLGISPGMFPPVDLDVRGILEPVPRSGDSVRVLIFADYRDGLYIEADVFGLSEEMLFAIRVNSEEERPTRDEAVSHLISVYADKLDDLAEGIIAEVSSPPVRLAHLDVDLAALVHVAREMGCLVREAQLKGGLS